MLSKQGEGNETAGRYVAGWPCRWTSNVSYGFIGQGWKPQVQNQVQYQTPQLTFKQNLQLLTTWFCLKGVKNYNLEKTWTGQMISRYFVTVQVCTQRCLIEKISLVTSTGKCLSPHPLFCITHPGPSSWGEGVPLRARACGVYAPDPKGKKERHRKPQP